MMQIQVKKQGSQRISVSRQGFTLVEILVALAIFMLLLTIILVPVNMGFNMLHIGKAQADVQSATQSTISQMRDDLAHAVYVFPNARLSPVTDKAPYYVVGTGVHFGPYLQLNGVSAITSGTATAGTCSGSIGTSNSSRLDMLLAQTDGASLLTPIQPNYYIVTYYARRRDINKPYQPIDNPVVLYRAQIPYYSTDINNPGYLKPDGTIAASGDNAVNADTSKNRYGTSCSDQGSWWLAQSEYGEPNLEPLTNENFAATPAAAFTLYGSHVSMIPVGMGMVTGFNYKGYNAQNQPITQAYEPPESTFVCADTNSDGVIDQVTLNLLLEKVDDAGAEPKGQQIALPQTVDLPNVRALSGLH